MDMNAMAGPSSPAIGAGGGYEYDAFDSDAFAPLSRPDAFAQPTNDPWARMKQSQAFGQKQVEAAAPTTSNPWAAFGRSTNGFGAGCAFTHTQSTPTQRYGGGRMPTPPDEDDEMMSDVEDVLDDGDDDEDDFEREEARRYGSAPPQRSFGELAEDKRALSMSGLDEQERVAALWQRGRRKT